MSIDIYLLLFFIPLLFLLIESLLRLLWTIIFNQGVLFISWWMLCLMILDIVLSYFPNQIILSLISYILAWKFLLEILLFNLFWNLFYLSCDCSIWIFISCLMFQRFLTFSLPYFLIHLIIYFFYFINLSLWIIFILDVIFHFVTLSKF